MQVTTVVTWNLNQRKNLGGRSNVSRHHLESPVHGNNQTTLSKINVQCFPAENAPPYCLHPGQAGRRGGTATAHPWDANGN